MYHLSRGSLAAADEVSPGSGSPKVDQLLERLAAAGSNEEFDRSWETFCRAHPDSLALWSAKVQRLIRDKDYASAIAMVDAHDFGPDPDGQAGLARAELLYGAKETKRAAEVFEQLLHRFPDRRDVRTSYAKRLYGEGRLTRACDMLAPISASLAEGSRGRQLWDKAEQMRLLLGRLEGRDIGDDEDARILAMKHAILHFRDRVPRKPSSEGFGRLTLITGSLGPGGAERQLSRLAISLEKARKSGEQVGGVELSRPVEVVVRSHGPEKQNDFYLGEVLAEGVELHQLDAVQPVSIRSLAIADPDLALLLGYLPPAVNYGVKRLALHLVRSESDTVSAWQDGACLFAGLAALVAGVPHVQLAVRGLPPNLRRHLFRPEYEDMYRAMAEVPGVTFLSNSRAAARAYCEWLDIPLERFAIVYNGVPQLPPVGTPDDEARWKAFVEATPDATHTIGGVFRFDTDKQPNVWIRFAARYLKSHPASRMLLVGGGRLLEGARELAEELGIADRILFTDRSSRVPYWMAKMDVFLLLSRYEGLPNVLIEAQYMGVRVVTTPAGGAPECLIEGTTGHVLECCEKPCLDNIVRCARDLADKSSDRALFAADGPGRQFLDENFSVPRMLASFVHSAVAGHALGRDADAALQAA